MIKFLDKLFNTNWFWCFLVIIAILLFAGIARAEDPPPPTLEEFLVNPQDYALGVPGNMMCYAGTKEFDGSLICTFTASFEAMKMINLPKKVQQLIDKNQPINPAQVAQSF